MSVRDGGKNVYKLNKHGDRGTFWRKSSGEWVGDEYSTSFFWFNDDDATGDNSVLRNRWQRVGEVFYWIGVIPDYAIDKPKLPK